MQYCRTISNSSTVSKEAMSAPIDLQYCLAPQKSLGVLSMYKHRPFTSTNPAAVLQVVRGAAKTDRGR